MKKLLRKSRDDLNPHWKTYTRKKKKKGNERTIERTNELTDEWSGKRMYG